MLPSEDCPGGRFPCNAGSKCKLDAGTKRAIHCGLIDRSEWAPKAELPPAFGGVPYEADVCPGWLCEQPAVIEGCQATAALKANALAEVFPDAPNPVIEAAMEGLRAFNLYENEQIQKAKRKA